MSKASLFLKCYSRIKGWFFECNLPFKAAGTHLLADMNQPKHIQDFQVLACILLTPQTRNSFVGNANKALNQTGKFDAYGISQMPIKELISHLDGVVYKNKKAFYIQQTAEMILKDFAGAVPLDQQNLMKLKGVGEKSSALFLKRQESYEQKHIKITDKTIVFLKRVRLIEDENDNHSSTLDKNKIQDDLQTFIDPILWKTMHIPIDIFVDTICQIEQPKCETCKLNTFCAFAKSQKKKENKPKDTTNLEEQQS